MRLNLRLAFSISLFTLWGCGPDWAKNLDTGRPVPNSRIEVQLPNPVPLSDLYQEFERLAIAEGLTEYRGRPIVQGGENVVRKFNWYPPDEVKRGFHVSFICYPWDTPQSTSFVVVLHNTRSWTNGAQEWLIFAKWKDDLLHDAFPEGVVHVPRHPAAFTPDQELLSIAEMTGIPIPDRDLSRVNEYKALEPEQ